ncbi:Rieske (2Fe-2S) protein [Candidatus Uhrbacteria bacterium]|nr:Rieske (2Fe-2S) protein [Candidatus Uhrbacteria bacterium]
MEPRKILIARVGEIPIGRTKSFRFGIANGIAYNDQGMIKAYINRCTHMGGPVELTKDQKIFRCRWHQAEFDPITGQAIEGEAPKGTRLEPIKMIEEDGQIFGLLILPEDPFA